MTFDLSDDEELRQSLIDHPAAGCVKKQQFVKKIAAVKSPLI